MKKTKKHIVLAVIAILIAALSFGYAYLTTTLTINGITDIDRNSWDVYFDNVQVTTGSVSGEQEIEGPTITSDTTVEFHVNLKQPGDFYEFTIEARNDGTIDAMIETVEKKLNGVVITTLPAYLNYTVTYEDNLEIEDNHLLASESLETYKIRVEYKDDIEPDDLPSSAQSLTLSLGVNYIQADSSAQLVEHGMVFTISSNNSVIIGQPIASGITQYRTAAIAMANFFNNPYFLKHKVENDIVTESYVGFVIKPENASANPGMTAGTYYIRGGGATSSNDYDSPYYENNKAVLLRAFGSSNCTDNDTSFTCNVTNFLYASTSANGNAYVSGAIWACSVDTIPYGYSKCKSNLT